LKEEQRQKIKIKNLLNLNRYYTSREKRLPGRYFGVIVPLVSVMLCHKKRMISLPNLLIILSLFHLGFSH